MPGLRTEVSSLKRRWGLVIDQERCIGCEACVVACRVENKPTAGRWIRVETQGGKQKDTPAGRFPDLRMDFLPIPCMHCEDPPCAGVCPAEALVKREDGPVVVVQDRCTGCQSCMAACPYDVIRFSEERGVIEKCDLCDHRIDQGLEPFCATCCEGQAIHFGDLADPASRVSQMAAEKRTFRLKPEARTNPSVCYRPPQEKRAL